MVSLVPIRRMTLISDTMYGEFKYMNFKVVIAV